MGAAVSLPRAVWRWRCAAALLFVAAAPSAAAVEVERRVDPETGLYSWKFVDHGLSLELIQLLGDYVRAVYGGMGFNEELLRVLDRYCVYGTIAKNLADRPLSYRVADWRYRLAGRDRPPKTKSEWVTEWRSAGIRYNWSILPDQQTFDIGDWSQGFTTVLAPRGSRFDLTVRWTIAGETHEATIDDMQCPPWTLAAPD